MSDLRPEPRLWYLRPYAVTEEAFPKSWLEECRRKILDSPLLSASTLNYRFSGTLGFSVAFRREGLEQMEAHFPEFMDYLKAVLHPSGNAFFLNPLVIYRGSRVAPHIDRSLKSWTVPDVPPCPAKVSVLYVDVPADLEGGAFVLHRRRPVATVQPRKNLLLEFQGKLRHEVTEVLKAGPDPDLPQPRISLVCEHYRLPPRLLARVPTFHVRTKRSFEEFLQAELDQESP